MWTKKEDALCLALAWKPFFFFSFYWNIFDTQCSTVSGVQQSESVMHIHMFTLFQIIFPYRPLQSIEQSFLFYTVRPYQLSILYIVVYSFNSNIIDNTGRQCFKKRESILKQ